MQDIYFRGRQPIPELLRIGLMTDHLAETLRLHPPEKLRGDVYLYVATPQGTRDVARLLPEEGYTYPVRRDIMQRAGTLAAYAEVQGADGMVWHSVPFTLVVAPLPGADKPLDAAQMTAMQQALTELRKLAARAEAAAERLEAGGAGGVTPEQYGAAGDATYKTETGAAKLAALMALRNATQTKTLCTLAEGSGTVWNTTTPKANYIYCPFTVKQPLTLKGLKFSLNTDNAQALTMGVSDVTETEAVDLATQSVTSVAGETEVDFTCSLPMETGKKYRIWIKTDSGDAIMAYPVLPDEKVAENDYFSITSETASDYRWNNTKIKFVGFVTVEV